MLEYKVVHIDAFRNVFGKPVSESDMEKVIDEWSGRGWKLISATDVSYSGTTKYIALFFFRPMNGLGELV